MSEKMTLNELRDAAHQNSVSKGFWDDQCRVSDILEPSLVKKTIGEKLMLVVTEAAEAMEDHRKNHMETSFYCKECDDHTDDPVCHVEGDGLRKPVGFPSELADIIIRVMDLAGALNIDLDREVALKMAYNRTRPYKHNKTC